jgi:60 kDa SS-A/Ro ribonucleoprotein
MNYAKHLTSVSEPGTVDVWSAPGTPEPLPGMVPNNAGGWAYEADAWNRLRRFLITGSEKGTFYVSEQKLTVENAQNIIQLLKQYPVEVIDQAVLISRQGLAKSNDTALFVLALALTFGDDLAKRAASAAVTQVARTGTHILHLAAMIDDLRGWGRAVRRAIGSWYNQPAERLGYQLAKYQSRDGWSHRDVLRSIHIKPATPEHDRLFRWAVGKYEPDDDMGAMRYIYGMKLAHEAQDVEQLLHIIKEYELEREHLPTRFLKDARVWEALLPNLKYEALIRNLGNMSDSGLLMDQRNEIVLYVCNYITDAENIRRSRVHPLKILSAWYTYKGGEGIKSSKTWIPVQSVVDALEQAFYQSFRNVEPINRRLLIAVDCSGSMGYYSPITGMNCFEAALAIAYITLRTESHARIILFSDRTITVEEDWGSMRFGEVLNRAREIARMAGTDCSLPYVYAVQNGIDVDGIVMYTDEESWRGSDQPVTMLRRYREQVNPGCRNVVCAMAANHAQLADPDDMLSLDIAGFSADTPQVVSAFLRGEF